MRHLDKFLIFDGAMGTMLQRCGLKSGELPESYNIIHPDIISHIHSEYINAGADIITTNTFGANSLKLESYGYEVEEIVSSAVGIARKAAKDKMVALDIGPIGKLMEPMGSLSFEAAYEIFSQQVKAGVKAGADVILIETMSDLYEAKAAILAAKELSSLPVFCTMTFQKDGRILTGADPLTVVTTLQALGADALGINCSLGPKESMPIVEKILKYSGIPVMVQPNAGLPRLHGRKTIFDVETEEFVSYMKIIAEKGVSILGGCCGTTPEYIKAIKASLNDMTPVNVKAQPYTAVSSGTKTVIIGSEVKIIGERINPTGKKKFKEALRNNDMGYILNEASAQRDAGADILDVNVGLPEIDEKALMKNAVHEIQGIVNLPLQIDSSSTDVIESAVRIYNGKPIINSVNGKDEVMKAVLPIVKKYGACVIGLTLDENGIPSSAEERFKIAEKIVSTAESYKIPRENILIDCLVLTASTQQKEVMETLKAVKLVKENLGVKTLLGVSNVSFGLPRRDILNRTYLCMALSSGLDAPIINPLSSDIMDTVNAFKVLANQDRESKRFISAYSNTEAASPKTTGNKKDLKEIVIKGMKEQVSDEVNQILKIKDPMQIIDEELIPALDEVGKKYESGELFLPQLIMAAETVKVAFDILKEHAAKDGAKKLLKGKILIATVKGDIHDIGKNIVKAMLENYGFDIVDMGKDVPASDIVRVVKSQNIKLVGLSALMTTTVKSMEQTINLLRKECPNCIIMVGGAVLNQEYADSIGADYYAADAAVSVKIAQKVLCNKYMQ